MRAISASKGERGLPWTDEDTKRAMTSSTAEMEAAADWARSMAGSALVGRLLAQAATTSPTAWCSSSEVRWMRSRFSRKARETAWSTALAELGSWGMRRFAGKLARFVILEGTRLGVNRRGVALCLQVPHLEAVSSQLSVFSAEKWGCAALERT